MNKNLSSDIQLYLGVEISGLLKDISLFAQTSGYKIYLVGGVVRDILLKNKCFDIDILVEGDALNFINELSCEFQNIEILKLQSELHTVKVSFPKNITIDFASTRTEIYPQIGYMPKTYKIGVSIIEDIKRRDFTVNTLLISLNKDDFGEVIDITGGKNDLKKRRLRILHKDSFSDDPTRILRCLKFAVRFDFEPDVFTENIAGDYLAHCNRNISFSRIKTEFIQTFNLNNPKAGKLFVEKHIYKLIADSINTDKDFDFNYLAKTVDKYLSESSYKWLIYLLIFFKENDLSCFSFTKSELKIIKQVQVLLKDKTLFQLSFEEKCVFFMNFTKEALIVYSFLKKYYDIVLFFEKEKNIKLFLKGKDFIKLGYKPSPLIGNIKKAVLAEKFKGKLLTKEEEINFVKKHSAQ